MLIKIYSYRYIYEFIRMFFFFLNVIIVNWFNKYFVNFNNLYKLYVLIIYFLMWKLIEFIFFYFIDERFVIIVVLINKYCYEMLL